MKIPVFLFGYMTAVALTLSGCAWNSYVEQPTPYGLVKVLSGRSNKDRTALVAQALSTLNIPYHEVPFDGGVNLTAKLGSKGPVFLITAHMDRLSGTPGANDNAACVAALVHAIHETPAPENITLRFLFTGGEKSFNKGSGDYASHLESDTIAGVVTFDLCGIGDTALAWDVTDQVRSSTIFQAFSNAAQEIGMPLAVHGPTDRFYNDHMSFAMRDIPAFAVNMVPSKDVKTMLHIMSFPQSPLWTQIKRRPKMFQLYKTVGDRPETLDRNNFSKIIRLVSTLSQGLDRLTSASNSL